MDKSHLRHPPSAGQPEVPEPSTESQVDIAADVQKGLKAADDCGENKADSGEGLLKPRDDTPAVIPKRSGPRNEE